MLVSDVWVYKIFILLTFIYNEKGSIWLFCDPELSNSKESKVCNDIKSRD